MLKKSKPYIAILLAFMLAFANLLPAMASQPEPSGSGPLISNDENNPVAATIAKKLVMPAGTITPTARFTFEATAVLMDNSNDGLGPDLGPWHVDFSSANIPGEAENDLVSVVLESSNIFQGVTFPSAGIYKYEITERKDTNDGIDDDEYQWLDYSDGKYIIFVYVENTSDGSGTYVAGLGTYVEEVDNDEHEEGEKVDPTPGGGDRYAYSQMVFTNTYVKRTPPTDPVINPTLAVEKRVDGNLANKLQYFDFNITVEISPLLMETMSSSYFRAYIVDLDKREVVTDISDNVAGSLINTGAEPNYIMIAPGATVEFKLMHNQRLAFVDTPVGASYTVEEKGVIDYKASVVVLSNNVETLNKSADIENQDLDTGKQMIGVLTNSAVFTNTRSEVTPAGLMLANLPFVVMILLGMAGIGFYVAMKVRRRENS